jgi:hypothetical protein
VAVDPYIPDGEVPRVEHDELVPGIAIVPVEGVGAGLSPGEVISVAPNGIPAGPTAEFVVMPRGEVGAIPGLTPRGLCCAWPWPQLSRTAVIATMKVRVMGISRMTKRFGERRSELIQSSSGRLQ